MNKADVTKLDDEEYFGIMSCLDQHVKTPQDREFHSVMVLFSDIANTLLNSDTPNGAYCILVKKEENFRYPSVLAKAKEIWAKGLIPIEITRSSGSVFFSIPQNKFFSGDLDGIGMIYSENEIPEIADFYVEEEEHQ